MPDLQLDQEQEEVRELAQRLGLDVLSPAARRAETEGAVPDKVWRTVWETGLVVNTPERFGGGGIADAVTQTLAVEGLAYGDAGITMAAVWRAAAALLIGLCGTEEQAAALLPSLGTDPDRRSAVACYEGFGRAPSEYETAITANPDGTWHVEGTKVAVAGGAGADPLVVVGVDPWAGRLRAVILEAGILEAAVRAPCTEGEDNWVRFGPEERHLALDAAPTASVTFDVEVPAASLLGGEDADPDALGRAVGRYRLAAAAAGLGTARRAVDYAAGYAGDRVAFGKPIAAFQGVSFLLAEGLIRLSAARLEVADAASRLDLPGHPGTEEAVTRAVNYAGVVATQSTRDALQVLGGHGFITDHPVELWYRTAATLSALDFDPLCSSFEPAL
jgi:alkylation response protein AidB-like acyl-CoA dehydrogenase